MIQNYIKYYFYMPLFDKTVSLHRQQPKAASQRQGRAARQVLKESITHSEINCDMTTKSSNNFHDLYCSLCKPLSSFYCGKPVNGEFLATETYPGCHQFWRCISFTLLGRKKDLGWARPPLFLTFVPCYEKRRLPICCFQHSCPAGLS